ncbi:MAG: helix-turn-helix domain-containing protein [Verrucomicrobia bacterium]|nr:helix-turn-helix domain-containing protein [Verrucomicrobiota bacterium]MBV8640792.1 helix-turn-helix domain-containing protein [Verrucomicrobiota bacterium]
MPQEIPGTSTQNVTQNGLRVDAPSYARHDIFTDSDHLSAAVRHANLELVQQGCGRFRGDLSLAALGSTTVQFIHLNQTSMSRAANASDRLALLIQLGGSQACLWNGYASQGSTIITYGPGHEHFGAEPREFACAFISIPLERMELLLDRCHRAVIGQLQSGCHQLQVPAIHFFEIEKRLTQLQALIESKPALLNSATVRQMFEHSLEESLLAIIHRATQGVSDQDPKDHENFGCIVRRTEEFLESHPDQPIHLIQLCAAIGVSPGLLRLAFRELLRIDPRRYLLLYRLHRARTALLSSDPSQTSVEIVARSWGFWSRLQFEAEYRWMFAELPSRTLARR